VQQHEHHHEQARDDQDDRDCDGHCWFWSPPGVLLR
jgi:hypothetical protein